MSRRRMRLRDEGFRVGGHMLFIACIGCAAVAVGAVLALRPEGLGAGGEVVMCVAEVLLFAALLAAAVMGNRDVASSICGLWP